MLPGNNNQIVTGSATTAGVVCTMTNPNANGFNILLDGQAQATSSITVAIQLLNPLTGNYSTPTGIGNPNVADPITLTNATTQQVQCPGNWPGIQVNVTSFGTATGTFRAMIVAY